MSLILVIIILLANEINVAAIKILKNATNLFPIHAANKSVKYHCYFVAVFKTRCMEQIRKLGAVFPSSRRPRWIPIGTLIPYFSACLAMELYTTIFLLCLKFSKF